VNACPRAIRFEPSSGLSTDFRGSLKRFVEPDGIALTE